MKKLKILGWIVALPFVVLALFVLARFAFCRPSYSVVKTATPMVEKMVDYIVEHGFPKSLEDIPNLPHRLEGCKTKIKYLKNNELITKKEEAEAIDIEHTCYFYKNKRKYFVVAYEIDFFVDKEILIKIRSDRTIVGSYMMALSNEKFEFKDIYTSLDTRGKNFCMQFKQ